MRLRKAAFVLTPCFAALLLLTPLVAANDTLGEQLKSHYENKVLTLRHFYKGNHLAFASDGTLSGNGSVGSWTVYGQIIVSSIELLPHNVQIKGRRVFLFVDPKAKPCRRKSSREAKTRDHDLSKSYCFGPDITIEVALPLENADVQQVSDTLAAVFVKPGESLADLVPDFWRDYFHPVQNRQPDSSQSIDTVHRVGSGVSPPRPVSSPEPEFSEEARHTGHQGVVTLSVVVDAAGKPNDLQIITPLGLGLDEKAVEAVRQWKFSPAMREKQPVAVKIAIEIDFHLY